MKTKPDAESPLFFKYGLIYYRAKQYHLYLTNKNEEFQKVLIEKGGSVRAVEIFTSPEDLAEFEKKLNQLNLAGTEQKNTTSF